MFTERDCALHLYGLRPAGNRALEYLAPRDGRPFPADEHSNDIVHRQTTVFTANADAAPDYC